MTAAGNLHRFGYAHAARIVVPAATVGLLAAGMVGVAGPAHAATTSTVTTVAAGGDAYVSSARPTYTFGGNLFIGQWEVTASKTGYLPQTKMISLVKGSPLTENFTLLKGP